MYFLDKASISKPFHALGLKTAAFQVFDVDSGELEYSDKNRQVVKIFSTVDYWA